MGMPFSSLVRTFHLGCSGTWLGAQVWVTFFAGLTIMKYLPRHTFGYVQSKLFPKYFRFGVVLSGVSLVTFVIDNPVINTWNFEQKLQAAAHVVIFLTVLANALYLGPVTTTIMFEKHKLEKEEEAGQGIGRVEQDKLVKLRENERYVKLEKRFSRLHGLSLMATFVSLSAQLTNTWFLSGHLRHL